MPWLALSLLDDAESVSYSKAIASHLSIRTIPQVVVLDCCKSSSGSSSHGGEYITHDAKSQIISAWNKGNGGDDDDDDDDVDDDAFVDLIRLWKGAPRIPLRQIKLGIVNKIFNKVQQGYQYFLGYSPSSNNHQDHPESISNNVQVQGLTTTPSSSSSSSHSKQHDMIVKEDELFMVNALMEFFQDATARLKVYPTTQPRMQLMKNVSTSHDDEHVILLPVSMEDHRRFLLQEQLQVLEDTIWRMNQQNDHDVTTRLSMDVVQEHLQSLGCNDFSNITDNDKIQQDLVTSMMEMNHHARNAFVRSILWSEMQWIKNCEIVKDGHVGGGGGGALTMHFQTDHRPLFRKNDGVHMDRKSVLEFCGLCNTAIQMQEVERFVKFGQEMLDDDDDDDDEKEHVIIPWNDLSVHQRMILLQQLLLCAVGFEPNFGGQELHRFMTMDLNHDDDDELKNVVESYLINMQLFAKNVGDGEDIAVGLSDVNDGGVTKVVSVKYSEKSIERDVDNGNSAGGGGGYDAPYRSRMEHNNEERQRQELKLAAKAASMQQEILDELLTMEDGERENMLKQARESHELFVQQCMSLAPGPERIAFLQNVPSEQQKLLLIHKLWEGRRTNSVQATGHQ